MNRSEPLTITFATRGDCGLILQFIEALAAYEKLLHEVVATRTGLEQTLFGDRPGAEVLIARWDGEPAGFALFFGNYSTFLGRPGIYLEDLFVYPRFRAHGIGKRLLQSLAAVAIDRDCGRLDWSVLNWNEMAVGFYQSLGARPLDEWTQFRLDGQPLAALAAQGSAPG